MATPPIPKDAREVYCNDEGTPIAYCPVDGLGVTDLQRNDFWQVQDHTRLRELAIRARQKERAEGQLFAVVCIDVDDPAWRPLVDHLMPDHDWQVFRDRGERPVARGVVPKAFIADMVARFYPAAGTLDETAISIVVFAAGGAAIHPVEGV